MDALDLRYEDGTFDIVFSLSSIEHFGSIGAAQKAVQEMERVCRTGGIVGIATEVVVDNGPHFSLPGLELFSPATLKELFASAPSLTATDDVSFDISRATLDTCLSLDAVLDDRNKGRTAIPAHRSGKEGSTVHIDPRISKEDLKIGGCPGSQLKQDGSSIKQGIEKKLERLVALAAVLRAHAEQDRVTLAQARIHDRRSARQ